MTKGLMARSENIVGIVKRINHKTATLETNSSHQWRVAYSFLYRIHDVESTRKTLSKGQ